MQADLHKATLANLADGALEQQFQDCLVQLLKDVIPDLGRFECGKDGEVRAKVKMEAQIEITPGEGTPSIIIGVRAILEPPKPKLIGRSLHLDRKDHQFVVWANEPKQEPLPLSRPGKLVAVPAEGK